MYVEILWDNRLIFLSMRLKILSEWELILYKKLNGLRSLISVSDHIRLYFKTWTLRLTVMCEGIQLWSWLLQKFFERICVHPVNRSWLVSNISGVLSPNPYHRDTALPPGISYLPNWHKTQTKTKTHHLIMELLNQTLPIF